MLPPAREAPPASADVPVRPSRWWYLLVVALALGAVLAVTAAVEVPYIAQRPGSAVPVADAITVEGAPSFPPEDSIALTTVRVGQARLLEAVVGWLDDDVDIVPIERIRGDRDEEENRRYTAQLMDVSKTTAIAVAQQALGLDVEVQITGTIVRAIGAGSPAEGVLELDDVIRAVDGEEVDESDELGRLLQVGGPGASHELVVERPAGTEERVTVTVTTIPAEDDPERAIIGIVPEDRISGFDLPIDVEIDSGQIGGPSAGLAFTLAVMDVLTPGEMMGGHRVAATGTIRLDETVGPVGGGAQKAITVRNAGYDTFLVPSDEYEQVLEAVGDDLLIVPVDTLDEALDALAELGGNARSLALPTAGDGS